MLPLCRPTPLASLSSPCGSLPLPRPLCGRIPSRCASRPLAYVPCHTLRPRKPPHPNPPRVWLLVPLLSTSSCIGYLLPHDSGSTILLAGCLHVMWACCLVDVADHRWTDLLLCSASSFLDLVSTVLPSCGTVDLLASAGLWVVTVSVVWVALSSAEVGCYIIVRCWALGLVDSSETGGSAAASRQDFLEQIGTSSHLWNRYNMRRLT